MGTTRNETQFVIVLLIALLLGILIGMSLRPRPPQPPTDGTYARTKRGPMATRRNVIDIYEDTDKAANQ